MILNKSVNEYVPQKSGNNNTRYDVTYWNMYIIKYIQPI